MCSKQHSFIAQLSSRVQEEYFFAFNLCFCLVSDELTEHENRATHWDNKYKNIGEHGAVRKWFLSVLTQTEPFTHTQKFAECKPVHSKQLGIAMFEPY